MMPPIASAILLVLAGCGGSPAARDTGVAAAAGSGDAESTDIGAGPGDARAASDGEGGADAATEARGDGGAGSDGATSFPQCPQFTVNGTGCPSDSGSFAELGGHYCGICDGLDSSGAPTTQPIGCIAVLSSGLPLLCVLDCLSCP